jgi:diacylglycerol kinase family enzyme
LSYVFSLADAFKVTRSFHAEIECDGKRQRLRCIHLAVGNGRHYGGGMTIAEDAAIDDGMLDLYALRPQSFSELLMLAPALRWGTHGQAERTLALRGCRIRVETTRPMRINADGEIVGTTPADFTVLPKALHVMVPRPEVAEAPGLHGHAA